jgi:hypothetical protein
VAPDVRNSVGGDIDPRTGDYCFTENARDWISDDLPDPKFARGHACSEFAPPVLNLGAHVAPLGMKFYRRGSVPGRIQEQHLPLAGQTDQFVQWQLVFFRSGRRQTPLMSPNAADLMDEDVRNLGAYFASLPRNAERAAEAANAELQARGRMIAEQHHCAAGATFRWSLFCSAQVPWGWAMLPVRRSTAPMLSTKPTPRRSSSSTRAATVWLGAFTDRRSWPS